jgi:hypothetical protein
MEKTCNQNEKGGFLEITNTSGEVTIRMGEGFAIADPETNHYLMKVKGDGDVNIHSFNMIMPVESWHNWRYRLSIFVINLLNRHPRFEIRKSDSPGQ